MICLHPDCPMGEGLDSWHEVLTNNRVRTPVRQVDQALAALNNLRPLGYSNDLLPLSGTVLTRLMYNCPCLYTQFAIKAPARTIVHLCEVTLGMRINSSNVFSAFQIQHPSSSTPPFLFPPLTTGASGGDIMEMLCSEVLINHGLPLLDTDGDNWPVWDKLGHVSLNNGKMHAVKAFGDILIPCAPSNIIISVKSEAAKERLLYSANMIEGVGFGFFKDASEFWTPSRMKLYKRMGFTAIYMPDPTFQTLDEKISIEGNKAFAVNVNGTPLYRPLTEFGGDMVRVAGKLSLFL